MIGQAPVPGGADEIVTVLLTDIENSTWLWEHHPADMAVVIPAHHELVARLVELAGQFVKSTGDGVLAVFRDAIDAVACAVEIQREVTQRAWQGIGRLHVRIGITTGRCSLAGGDVIGRPPNLAARLQTAGHGGQILVSGSTAAACAGRSPGVVLRDLGEYTMRGFDEPVGVHMVLADGLRSEFPPLRAAYRGFEDLPPDEGALAGRDDAIRDATRAVHANHLVTLWGPAGVGKTRLAVRVASVARHPFDDGIRFVDLSSVDAGRLVPDAFLRALRAQPARGELPVDTVRRAVRTLRLLLVVDNCEHVLDGVREIVEAIGTTSPSTHVLATSRRPLGLVGERALTVAPLSIPRPDAMGLAELGEVEAVQLFTGRVAESRPGFRLTATNAPMIGRICRATDGLPYALELAAARTVVDGLDAVDPASAPGRARVVAIEADLVGRFSTTLSTLDPRAIDLLCRLAVFAGPFSRELAVSVAIDPRSAEGELRALVRSAMVQHDEQDGTYRLLTPARAFGWQRLAPAEQDEAAAAHASVMVTRAERFGRLLKTADQVDAVRALNDELAEHGAAFEHLLASGELGDAARLVCALFQHCLFQPRPEGQKWAARVAERISDDDDHAADVLGAAALAAWSAGDTAVALDLGGRAIDLAEGTGGSSRWGRTALVDALSYAGRFDEAVPHFAALISALGHDDDPYWRVNGLGLEAVGLTMIGRHEVGHRRATEALAVARGTGNPECLHWGLYALGCTLAANDPVAACVAFEQAMRWSRAVDSRFNVGLALVEWVALKRQLGDGQAAVAGALDLLSMLVVSGQRSQLSQALREGGLLLAAAGQLEDAAIALVARSGLPAMPKGRGPDDAEAARLLVDLRHEVGPAWGQVRVLAQALTEAELVDHVRDGLVLLQTDGG